MKPKTILLLAITATLLFSCSTLKTTQDRVEFEFEVAIQSEIAKGDVYRVALEICKEN